MTVEAPSLATNSKIWKLSRELQWMPITHFPASLTYLPQVAKILFSEKEAWWLSFHNSDPFALPLVHIRCHKTMPRSPVLVYAPPWTLTLILLEVHHHSSLLNSAGRVHFWKHIHPTNVRHPATRLMNPDSQQKKGLRHPTAWTGDCWEHHSTAWDEPWHTVANHGWVFKRWPFQPMSFASSAQLTVFIPPSPPHHASRRKFKSRSELL